MKSHRQQLALFFGTLFFLLAVSFSASATNSVKFILKATVEGPTTTVDGITRYETTKLKITNKEMLTYLGLTYPVALNPDAVLAVNSAGDFVINDGSGALLQAVSTSVLRIQFGNLYRKGMQDTNVGDINFKNVWSPADVVLDIDSNNGFELYGGMSGTWHLDGSLFTAFYTLKIAGLGALGGDDCFIEGKLLLKYKP